MVDESNQTTDERPWVDPGDALHAAAEPVAAPTPPQAESPHAAAPDEPLPDEPAPVASSSQPDVNGSHEEHPSAGEAAAERRRALDHRAQEALLADRGDLGAHPQRRRGHDHEPVPARKVGVEQRPLEDHLAAAHLQKVRQEISILVKLEALLTDAVAQCSGKPKLRCPVLDLLDGARPVRLQSF